jgi:hypothetical protein
MNDKDDMTRVEAAQCDDSPGPATVDRGDDGGRDQQSPARRSDDQREHDAARFQDRPRVEPLAAPRDQADDHDRDPRDDADDELRDEQTEPPEQGCPDVGPWPRRQHQRRLNGRGVGQQFVFFHGRLVRDAFQRQMMFPHSRA